MTLYWWYIFWHMVKGVLWLSKCALKNPKVTRSNLTWFNAITSLQSKMWKQLIVGNNKQQSNLSVSIRISVWWTWILWNIFVFSVLSVGKEGNSPGQDLWSICALGFSCKGSGTHRYYVMYTDINCLNNFLAAKWLKIRRGRHFNWLHLRWSFFCMEKTFR